MLFALSDELGELLYQDRQVGGLLRLYAPLVPMLYTDALVDAMCKGLGQQNANARYNMLTSFLDVVLLWYLLPQLGLRGYFISFTAAHLANFALSLRRLIKASGIRLSLGKTALAALCAGAAGGVASLTDGMLPSGGCYLLLLGGLWYLCRIVDGGDLAWLRGLIRGRPPAC